MKIGTLFEDSRVPCIFGSRRSSSWRASKKGISANQLHRAFGVTLKAAWFISHGMRLPMPRKNAYLIGGNRGTVEADETYVGRKPGTKVHRGAGHKETVFSLVQRGGKVRSTGITGKFFAGIKRSLKANVSEDAVLMTDSARFYRNIAKSFADHRAMNHEAGDYFRATRTPISSKVTFGIQARHDRGQPAPQVDPLRRHLAEFDFRYNSRIAL